MSYPTLRELLQEQAGGRASAPAAAQELELLQEAYPELARAEGAHLLPMYGRIPPASLLADGVHPDRAGNLPLADAFAEFLRTLPDSGVRA